MTGIRAFLLLLLPATLLAGPPDVPTLVRQGIAYQEAGHNPEAVSTLERAVALAEQTGDRRLLLLAKSSLGAVCTCSRQAAQAEKNLQESLALARELDDTNTTAVVHNNLGNLFAAQGKLDDALAAFAKAGTATANANAAAVAARAKRDAAPLNAAALSQLPSQPATRETGMLWLRCGQTDLQLRQPARAEESFRQALRVAEELKDDRLLSYALGNLGSVPGRADALELTRQAAFLAQANDLPEALYRWEWQTGRLLAAAGQRAEAVAAYRRAVQTLQPIRAALTQGCGAARPTFRESVAPVYYELADLLLQQDAALTEARDLIEQLQAAELDDYLQDECAANQRAGNCVTQLDAHTAVVHIIPLTDRTEVLLQFKTGLERIRVPVAAEQLLAEVRQLRTGLERRTTNQYLLPAQQLYKWLITPALATLKNHQVTTLVFVPDGDLRTIPLAALHDGKQFLIERFAVAVSPGITLMETHPLPHGRVTAFAGGLAAATQNFAELPGVPAELRAVATAFHTPVVLDEQFTTAALRQGFAKHQFQVVHFATHGQVDKDITKSFILTHDGRLTLDELETLLRPGQFRGRPVELLTLSACQTAAGDERAALGLAGVAVKAGARSALATLWFVNDESTTLLMEEFYRELKTTTKAQALQRAQVKVLRDPRFGHAGYWAAYLLIGNWL